MMRLSWSLPCAHTTKLINCKCASTFFSLSIDIWEFWCNIKGLEIVGQIVIYNYQSDKFMKEMFFLKMKKDLQNILLERII